MKGTKDCPILLSLLMMLMIKYGFDVKMEENLILYFNFQIGFERER